MKKSYLGSLVEGSGEFTAFEKIKIILTRIKVTLLPDYFYKYILFFSPIILFFVLSYSLLFYSFFSIKKEASRGEILGLASDKYNVFTSKVDDSLTYKVDLNIEDSRADKIKKVLEKHDSPIAHLSDFFVEMADKYSIDWRLVPAIGFCEGSAGKRIPEGSFNTWGWAASEKDLEDKSGAYNLGSWEKAIETVTKGLKKGYIDKGLITPNDIMYKYAPQSPAKGGPWAKCVEQYIKKIDDAS
ncbi:hypothetical protein KA001_02535 [Patescibacteria group bacterium]|nr:hypothetical protein [Patescibacteria group bacterium]